MEISKTLILMVTVVTVILVVHQHKTDAMFTLQVGRMIVLVAQLHHQTFSIMEVGPGEI